jgi:Fe-S cluster biosynthesis and repair protein YggX
MAQRMVKCVKFGRELPGLDEPPFDNDLGRRIYENVSQDAWRMWIEHLKMVVNEYRLNLADREAQKQVRQYMEEFFFGEGAGTPPPGYVPPQGQQ